MSDTTTVQRGGVGFLGLLTIALVVLKATGYLTWSWWLVFAPVWAPFALVLALFVIAGIFYGILHLLDVRDRRRNRRR
jgi:membrane protein YdbS with pleckstrin-like domain